MSRRDVTVTLRQMIDYSQKAVTPSRGRKRGDLDSDLTLNLAVDFDFLWGVIRNDLPALIKQLKKMI